MKHWKVLKPVSAVSNPGQIYLLFAGLNWNFNTNTACLADNWLDWKVSNFIFVNWLQSESLITSSWLKSPKHQLVSASVRVVQLGNKELDSNFTFHSEEFSWKRCVHSMLIKLAAVGFYAVQRMLNRIYLAVSWSKCWTFSFPFSIFGFSDFSVRYENTQALNWFLEKSFTELYGRV